MFVSAENQVELELELSSVCQAVCTASLRSFKAVALAAVRKLEAPAHLCRV